MTDIDLPDTASKRPAKSTRHDDPEDVTRARDRLKAFWAKHPEGSILTEVEEKPIGGGFGSTATDSAFTVRAFVRRDANSEFPSATAHATRATNDPDELVAQFPQETAETAAVSRALRNAGILTHPRKTKST